MGTTATIDTTSTIGHKKLRTHMRLDEGWPQLLHDDEHVKSLIYGRHNGEMATMVATAERIIYLYRHAAYTLMDEIAYDEVMGVGSELNGRYATVRLLTSETEYVIRGVNEHNADDFVQFVEGWQLDREVAKRYFVLFGAEDEAGTPDASDALSERTAATRVKSIQALGDARLSGYYWTPQRE